MNGRELRFFLQKSGVSYSKFAENVGKCQDTIQKWISHNRQVGQIYVVHLEKLLGRRNFDKIQAEWEEMQADQLSKLNDGNGELDDGEQLNVVYQNKK